MWMSVNKNVWHIAKDSSRRWQVGRRGGEKICTHNNKVASVWRRRKLAGVCVCARVFHLSIGEPWRSERNSENERKVYGKVDETFCVGEWKGISRLEDLDMNIIIIRFTVRLMRHQTGTCVFFFFIRLFFSVRIQDKPSPLFLSSLFSRAVFNHVGFSAAWTHRLLHTGELGRPEWLATRKMSRYFTFASFQPCA